MNQHGMNASDRDLQSGSQKGKNRPLLDVLVVDDSALVREVMRALLSQEHDIAVRTAADPFIAMEKMKQARPDVIVLDLEMPRMDGLTFLHKVMEEDPIPVVICSGLADSGTEAALRALEEGAVGVLPKPKLGIHDFLYESRVLLMDTIRDASRARLRQRGPQLRASAKFSADAVLAAKPFKRLRVTSDKFVVIGASTGGTEALRELLEAMPLDCPGLVVVQHMPEMFTSAFAQRLHGICRIDVKEAANGDRIVPGRALVAPGNRHTLVWRDGGHYIVKVTDGPLVSRHRPSVDVLFRSVAQSAGSNALGVIMTGMGDDGANGLREMKEAGAWTIAQDESSCIVFGMPKEAIARGAVDQVVSLSHIASAILERVRAS